MVRRLLVASGALVALVVNPFAPIAAAQDAVVVIGSGTIRCLLTADDPSRGGGPFAVCQRSDGSPWGQTVYSAEKYAEALNQAVMRGTGEFYWDGGNIRRPAPVPEGGVAVGPSGTYSANGWTVQGEGPRTRITNDTSEHGLLLYPEMVRTF